MSNYQLSLLFIFSWFFHPSVSNIWSKRSFTVLGLIFLIIMILITQCSFFKELKESQNKRILAWSLRTIVFYTIIRVICPLGYYKEIGLFISFILSLHLAFTAYMSSMRRILRRKVAFLCMIGWLVVTLGLISMVKDIERFSLDAIYTNVFLTVLYGIYLVYETEFLLSGYVMRQILMNGFLERSDCSTI